MLVQQQQPTNWAVHTTRNRSVQRKRARIARYAGAKHWMRHLTATAAARADQHRGRKSGFDSQLETQVARRSGRNQQLQSVPHEAATLRCVLQLAAKRALGECYC